METKDTQKEIDILFNNFRDFLKEKNRRYGDSAMQPIQIFSRVQAEDQILNRLDDKLGRIKRADKLKKNDVADVFGYVALLMVKNGWTTFEEMLD